MKKWSPILALLLCVALTGLVQAQCVATNQVATQLCYNNAQSGTMFDVVNVGATPITITQLSQSFNSITTNNVAIYTKTGSWNGFDTNFAAWTLLGTVSVTSPAIIQYTPIPLPLSVSMAPGATQAFYVTWAVAGLTVLYTNGGTTGTGTGCTVTGLLNTTIGSDANIQIKCGPGKAWGSATAFGASFGLPSTGRAWNGRVSYTIPYPAVYQQNSAHASLTFDGVVGGCATKAQLTKCPGANTVASFASTLLGNGYEVVISYSPLVVPGSGAYVTGNGQIVNVNLADPSTFFLWNLGFPPFPFPFGNSSPANVAFGYPAVPTISAQLAVLDGSNPDGFSLSQPTELHLNTGTPGTTIPGPQGDDNGTPLVAGQAYFPNSGCTGFIAPALPLYGQMVNSYTVTTNGHIDWPGYDLGYLPTVALAQSGVARVGCWEDLLVPPGNITIDYSGSVFTVAYNQVGFSSTATTNATFTIAIDVNTGIITMTGLSTLGLSSVATENVFLGISQGASAPGGLATDPGMAAFGVGASGGAALVSDMIYTYGVTGSNLGGGANVLVLTPNGGGNYNWATN